MYSHIIEIIPAKSEKQCTRDMYDTFFVFKEAMLLYQ